MYIKIYAANFTKYINICAKFQGNLIIFATAISSHTDRQEYEHISFRMPQCIEILLCIPVHSLFGQCAPKTIQLISLNIHAKFQVNRIISANVIASHTDFFPECLADFVGLKISSSKVLFVSN